MKSVVMPVLKAHPSFSGLEAKDLDMLASSLSVEEHSDGEILCREGDHADGAFLIIEGEVEVGRDRSGRHETLTVLGKGALFGHVALLDDRRRSATCRAKGSTKTAWLPESAFQLLVQSSTPAAKAVQHALATQLCADFRRLRAELISELRAQG